MYLLLQKPFLVYLQIRTMIDSLGLRANCSNPSLILLRDPRLFFDFSIALSNLKPQRHQQFCCGCVYFYLPNIGTLCKFSSQEKWSLHFAKIRNQITILILYYISSTLITLLKATDPLYKYPKFICFPKCLVVARLTFLDYIALLRIPQSLHFKSTFFDFKNTNILHTITFNNFYFNNEQFEDYGTSKNSLFPPTVKRDSEKLKGIKKRNSCFTQSVTPAMIIV